MGVKAFIAHTAQGGIDLGKVIEEQLIQPPLEVRSFLSEHAIKYGEHIPESVLRALIESDILFVILEPLVIENEWVKWEYEFGKKHNIKTICIVYMRFFAKLDRITWLDHHEKYLIYDGNNGAFRNEIWNETDDMMPSLRQQVHDRNAIKIDARTDKTHYSKLDTIKVSGNVKGSLMGTAYLHIPRRKKECLPIRSTNIGGEITPDDDGCFEFKYKLPRALVVAECKQKWLIELKFGKKSQLIPICVCDKNGGKTKPHDDPSNKPKSSKSNTINQKEVMREINGISEGTFQSIPKTISGHAIRRDDKISELMTMLEENDRIVITGEKGSGKSVFLCQLYKKISEQQTVLFIRCDDYLRIESTEQLNRTIILGHNCIDQIRDIATDKNKLVVIFDSLDAISRNEKSMNVFKHFLKSVWGANNVTTISSVRSYDYEYSPNIRDTDWGAVYRLELLTKNETDVALTKLGNPTISPELKNILFNPLHLKLLSLILERSSDANLTNIKNEIELYDEHWDEYVEKLEQADDVRNVLYRIAQKMSSTQRIAISHDDLGYPNTMHMVLSRNIVLRNSKHDQITFFHHAYLDYVVSRFILAKHSDFVDFLLKDEYNVFLRPTIVFALSVLHKRDPKQFIGVVNKILNSQLKYFWKISALTALARVDKPDDQDFSVLGRFLTKDATLQRHFLIEIEKRKNHFWFNLWKNLFFIDWSSSAHNPNGWLIVSYLKSVLEKTHELEPVFKILQCVTDRSEPGWAGQEAIELSSEINVRGKTEWLHKLSTNKDAHVRTGVLKTLPKLIGTNPKAVPDIFCNIFTYNETSDDVTQLMTHGTTGFVSTRRQDNSVVIWEAEGLFPTLLKENPKQMIASAIKILEKLRKNELSEYKDNVIEDHGYIWFVESSSRHVHGESILLTSIIQYLHDCSDKELSELEPLLSSTSLATFHSILIGALIKRNNTFTNTIFNMISNPRVYEITTLRHSVRSAIKEIGSSLTDEQVRGLLANVMNIWPNRELDEEEIKARDMVKAQFLSSFPTNVLQPEHQKILDEFSEYDLEHRLPYHEEVKIQVGSDVASSTEPSIEEIITSNLGKELEHGEKLELLAAISKYLDRDTKEINNTKIQPIKEFLIENRNDPDPGYSVGQDPYSAIHDTVRGTVARCLVKLLYRFNDSTLILPIRKLSDDPINIVRGEVCNVLKYLFCYDYDLAYSIAKKYSTDDSIVQFYLPNALLPIVNKHPERATLIISNMLDRQTRGIENFLIYLAFHKKEPRAIALLNKITDKKSASHEIRRNIPFILKEHWLFKDKFQIQSLDLLYKLLDDLDNEIRYNAAFFTLNSFEKDDSVDINKFVSKINKHLDRIALEVDREPWDPRLLEELVRFLTNFWYLLPEKTIDYLEKMTNEKIREYAAHQPVFAENSVKILTGLFQHTLLSKENRERCLNILDTYAMAGWSAALQLLGAMERPD